MAALGSVNKRVRGSLDIKILCFVDRNLHFHRGSISETDCRIKGLEPRSTNIKSKRKVPRNKSWNFSNLLPKMVGVEDVRWNTIESSLVLMCTKMIALGFSYDGENIIPPAKCNE